MALGLEVLKLRQRCDTMKVVEVSHIDPVFGHLPPLAANRPAVRAHVVIAPLRVGPFGDLGHIPQRVLARRMPPEQNHAVALHDRVGADSRQPVQLRAVGNLYTITPPAVLPGMKRTADRAALHAASVAQMGTQVRAKRIQDVRLAVLVTPEDEIAAKHPKRSHLSRPKLLLECRLIPAERERI